MLSIYLLKCGGPELTPKEKKYRTLIGNRLQCFAKHVFNKSFLVSKSHRLIEPTLLSLILPGKAHPPHPCHLWNRHSHSKRLPAAFFINVYWPFIWVQTQTISCSDELLHLSPGCACCIFFHVTQSNWNILFYLPLKRERASCVSLKWSWAGLNSDRLQEVEVLLQIEIAE